MGCHMKEKIRTIACAVCKALGGEVEKITHVPSSGTIDASEMSSILLDKLDEMGDNQADIHLADINCKVYDREIVQNSLCLEEVSKLKYVVDKHDCDDFAADLYGRGIPLLWTNLHAMNWFVDRQTLILWFVEPQTRKLSRQLESWQGWEVRFFINR